MRYIDGLQVIPDTEPTNALILGHAMHTGIEQGVEAGISEYFNAFPLITDEHITEQIKLEHWIPIVQDLIPPNGQFEVELSTPDFHGFIDYLVPISGFHGSEVPNVYDIYDFKYASNASRYADSAQLHLYKYYFEKCFPGKTIRNLTYLVIPKHQTKQNKGETVTAYRCRVKRELKTKEIKLVPVGYDPEKVIDFLLSIKRCLEETEYPCKIGFLCKYCDYYEYCQKGIDYMLLPENKRRNLSELKKRVIWVYGAPFSGKTFFANEFPDVLMLNTDGNIKLVDAPFILIKDEVKVNGRLTERTLGWEVFKNVISELEKKQNDFKTIVVDLLEDTYEMCRLYMYDKMEITHESDDPFKAWDKVRTEFLSTLRRLMNMDYENIILISHEDASRDITKKGGDKITSISPNIQDKVARKVAGMVDIVARLVSDGDQRILSFKTSEVIFGGGRLTVSEREIPCSYENLCKVYDEANQSAVKQLEKAVPAEPVKEEPKPVQEEPKQIETVETPVETVEPPVEEPKEEPKEEAEPVETPPRRMRKRKERV